MKPLKLVLSLALATITLSSDLAPAFATKMDGRCCVSSDGGRSARYRHSWRFVPFRALAAATPPIVFACPETARMAAKPATLPNSCACSPAFMSGPTAAFIRRPGAALIQPSRRSPCGVRIVAESDGFAAVAKRTRASLR